LGKYQHRGGRERRRQAEVRVAARQTILTIVLYGHSSFLVDGNSFNWLLRHVDKILQLSPCYLKLYKQLYQDFGSLRYFLIPFFLKTDLSLCGNVFYVLKSTAIFLFGAIKKIPLCNIKFLLSKI
jgi:hypothetical protein